jgi:hypothetical protein
VYAGMAILHHNGDVTSRDFSPANAFFFTKLRIREIDPGLNAPRLPLIL